MKQHKCLHFWHEYAHSEQPRESAQYEAEYFTGKRPYLIVSMNQTLFPAIKKEKKICENTD